MEYTNEQLALKLAVEWNQGKRATLMLIQREAEALLKWLQEHPSSL